MIKLIVSKSDAILCGGAMLPIYGGAAMIKLR